MLSHGGAADGESPAYAPARALRESSGLASASCMAHFCEAVSRFVRSGQGEQAVAHLAAIVAHETRRRGLPAERMLTAFRIADCGVPDHHTELVNGSTASLRYLRATRVCLAEYFRPRLP